MTKLLEDIDSVVETEKVKNHYWCTICYEELIPFETKAVCGTVLAGVRNPKGTCNCAECMDLWRDHVIQHIWDGVK